MIFKDLTETMNATYPELSAWKTFLIFDFNKCDENKIFFICCKKIHNRLYSTSLGKIERPMNFPK